MAAAEASSGLAFSVRSSPLAPVTVSVGVPCTFIRAASSACQETVDQSMSQITIRPPGRRTLAASCKTLLRSQILSPSEME